MMRSCRTQTAPGAPGKFGQNDSTSMRPTKIGERVEVDLCGLRTPGGSARWDAVVAPGTVVGLAPGSITIRLDEQFGSVVTVGPARLVGYL